MAEPKASDYALGDLIADVMDPRQAERDADDASLDAHYDEEAVEDRASRVFKPLFEDDVEKWFGAQL